MAEAFSKGQLGKQVLLVSWRKSLTFIPGASIQEKNRCAIKKSGGIGRPKTDFTIVRIFDSQLIILPIHG